MALTGNVWGEQSVAKAWVSFNGTGTVAIRDSFNVTSITDNGTGDYTTNFTVAMANQNYAAVGAHSYTDATRANFGIGPNNNLGTATEGTDKLAASCRCICGAATSAADPAGVYIVFFGDSV